MSTPPTPPSVRSLSTQAVVLISVVAALVVLLIIGLVYLAGPDGRADVFAWLSSVFALGATAFGVTGVVQNRSLAASVAKVDKQTNGILDQRIADGAHAALVKAGLAPDVTAPAQDATPAADPAAANVGTN